MAQTYAFAMRTDKEFELVKSFVVANATSGFCVRETKDGSNEHWHWLIFTTCKAQSWRVKLTRAVPALKGNACYSVSEVKDMEGYKRYMCKGESVEVMPEVVWEHGLDWGYEELHAGYWEANRQSKKRKAGSVIDYVIDEAKRTAIAWDDRKELTRCYLKEVVARSKPINIFSVKSGVLLVQAKLCPDDQALEEIVDRCLV